MGDARLDHDLARLSAAVYHCSNREAARAVAAVPGWHLVEGGWMDHAGSEAMLCAHADRGVEALVFRGTEASAGSLGDLWANVSLWPRTWAGSGRAHAGYADQLGRILPLSLERYRLSDRPVLATGHSMGGALATLFAAFACRATRAPAALVTFGAPKALDRAGRAALDCPVRRYEVRGDFAPWWPPSVRLVHPAPATWLPGRRWWHGPLRRHSVEAYMARVAALKPRRAGGVLSCVSHGSASPGAKREHPGSGGAGERGNPGVSEGA